MSSTDRPVWAGPARFPPLPAPTRRDDGALHYSGVTYAIPFGYRPLQLDLWTPAAAAPPPVVVWVHGGSWMTGDRRLLPARFRPGQLFDALLESGLAVATIDYRLAREASFPAQLHDAKAAIRHLRAHADELGVETRRIGIWGESAGGHLAALVGLTARRRDLEGNFGVAGPSSAVDVVVDWYGPSDLELLAETPWPPEIAAGQPAELLEDPLDALLAGADAATRADASPVTHVAPGAPPFLLVHGTEDPLVPIVQSEVLEAALTEAGVPVRLLSVSGAGHVFDGHEDIDAIVRSSVDHLASALLEVP
jgi:acetyl esterase/lipase